MPTTFCSNCRGRRPVADYIARLPLLCTKCATALTIVADNAPLDQSAEYFPSQNDLPQTQSSPLFVEQPSFEEQPAPAEPPRGAEQLSNTATVPELALGDDAPPPVHEPDSGSLSPTDFAISILPDRELSPLVVLEKPSYSTMELPNAAGSQASKKLDNLSEKSKFAERLKEITSLSAERPQAPSGHSVPTLPSLPTIDYIPMLVPAPIWKRFVARTMVGALGSLTWIACVGWSFILMRLGVLHEGTAKPLALILFLIPAALVALLHLVLLGRRGQDVGKWVMRLRIVDQQGRPVGFYRAVILRELPMVLFPFGIFLLGSLLAAQTGIALLGLPFVLLAILLTTFDSLMIFSESNRCLHDHMANTRVISLDPS